MLVQQYLLQQSIIAETNLNLPIIIGAALIDSINPCAIGVLVFLLAYLLKTMKQPGMMLLHGLVYIFAVFLTYLAAGLLLLPIIQSLGNFSVVAYFVIAVLVILAGLIEIKDYFCYGKGISLNIGPAASKRIEMYVKKISNRLSTSFALGVFVALVELPCTGAVYLGILSLMALAGVEVSHIVLLVLYNIIFVLPLIVILWLFYGGVSAEAFEAWRKRHRGSMRLMTGLLLLLMGVWLILYVTV
ncbi:MAG: hypothetical protein A2788_01805 [Candidatus Abawacabacteria bacterium RIFCSPHIGHO2_01_FULL_46_8]|uniref:Uncharacterized protein n=1 Tax=Candidatus Abawacabacteria bacterium RIFCSPHIGHO2_01_FULL_46_8 TaxID=1817815 RepID=A0A1F4XJ06_9BACT|nr:MAG: hypothetical protein A2788_01805 [Candidatus Abawacabacteria bacterium RIFCSPHIGHO2_01_FULL_46_8]